MSVDIERRLDKLQREWEDADPRTGGGGSNVDDGEYVAGIKEMLVEESRKKGLLQLVTVWEIMDGEFKGDEIRRFDQLETREHLPYVKGYLEVIGMDWPRELRDMERDAEDFVRDLRDLFDISVKTKGDYQNVEVIRVSEYVDDGKNSGREPERGRERERERESGSSRERESGSSRERERGGELNLSDRERGRERESGRERERGRGKEKEKEKEKSRSRR